MSRPTKTRRGRPLKFGRPTQLVTLTLPDDVVSWLTEIDDDLAWALVKLHERAKKSSTARRLELAGLFQIPGNRALILVRPEYFDQLRGVSLIPLADGRAFLALEPTKGVADLELAVIDRLEGHTLDATERDALTRLRGLLQQWRREGINFESRSIVLAKRKQGSRRSKPLAALEPRVR